MYTIGLLKHIRVGLLQCIKVKLARNLSATIFLTRKSLGVNDLHADGRT